MSAASAELALAPVPAQPDPAWARLESLVIDSVSSPHSKRAYRQALTAFARWCAAAAAPGFTKATVQAWRAALEAEGLAASSINVRLAAIKKARWRGSQQRVACARYRRGDRAGERR